MMKKSQIYIKLFSFILLLVAMFVLNNNIEKTETGNSHKAETVLEASSDIVAIAPLLAKVPNKTTESMPIKLISNLNSDFLFFINYSHEFRNEYHYIFLQKHFLGFCHKIQRQKLISYLVTARSKDIQ